MLFFNTTHKISWFSRSATNYEMEVWGIWGEIFYYHSTSKCSTWHDSWTMYLKIFTDASDTQIQKIIFSILFTYPLWPFFNPCMSLMIIHQCLQNIKWVYMNLPFISIVCQSAVFSFSSYVACFCFSLFFMSKKEEKKYEFHMCLVPVCLSCH